uniref:C4b-binding protein alpha chain-like n=1 Tax=Pristiophorus japonicus TaxID=55135 RepID=UPI00398E86A5
MAETLNFALLIICMAAVARVTGDCGKPPVLDNGSLTEDYITEPSFSVGDTVTYKCFSGYVFQPGGSWRITCQEDSTWSPLRAVCEPKNCGNPGEILNGYYTAPDTTFGNKATFYCNVGYLLVGRNYRLCTVGGWDGQVPTCDPVRCPDPPSVRNGTASSPSDGGEYGTIVSYSCDSGYSLIGNKEITCTATGKWEDPPTCKVVQCHRPETPKNGKIVAGFGPTYTYQDSIIFKCEADFKMVGKDIIECGENSTFVPQPPTCEPRDCDKPPQLENGSPTNESISQASFPVGANVTYMCNSGYIFEKGGSRHITCQRNSTWSPLRAICEPVRCPDPPPVSHGTVSSPSEGAFWEFGMNASYSCDSGYSLIGKEHITCTATGKWEDPPTCKAVRCPDPPSVRNGTASSPSEGGFWTFGMNTSYTCDSGYSLIGNKYIMCTATGKWEDPPKCKVVQCHRPETPKNGTILEGFGPTYSYQDTITFKCDVDFKMVGKNIIECGENSTFVPQPPTCEPSKNGSVGTSVGQQFELLLVLGVSVFLVMSYFD